MYKLWGGSVSPMINLEMKEPFYFKLGMITLNESSAKPTELNLSTMVKPYYCNKCGHLDLYIQAAAATASSE
jgi:hypothetical protein